MINEAVLQKPQVKAFVFTSSIAAYGASDGIPPFTERSPQTPEGELSSHNRHSAGTLSCGPFLPLTPCV